MKKLIISFIVLSMFMVGGCSSQSDKTDSKKAQELYKGLDAKGTYEKAINYFNETVNYYKEVVKIKKDGQIWSEWLVEQFHENDKYNQISIHYSKSPEDNSIVNMAGAQIYKDNTVAMINTYNSSDKKFKWQDMNEEFETQQYKLNQKPFLKVVKEETTDDGTKIISINREDKDEDIIVSIKYSYINKRPTEDGKVETIKNYTQIKHYINAQGLIYKQESSSSEKENETGEYINDIQLTDINKKKTFDFETEYKRFDKLNGKEANEIMQFFK